MATNKELREKLIRNNPNLSTTKLLEKAKVKGISNRRTDFLTEVRNIRKLPEPSKAKKEGSIPTKYKSTAQKSRTIARAKLKPTPKKFPTVLKPKAKIPFGKTKFGRIVKDLQTKHNISEKRAIIQARRILKIPKKDYNILNQIDYDILIQYGY